MTATHTGTGGNKGQGSNWIRKARRWAIYMRDSWTCVYCEREDVALTLDHVHPRELGGGNETSNLVTACRACNTAKGKKSLDEFTPTRTREIQKRLRVKIDTRAARVHMKADEALVTRVRNNSNPAHSAYRGAA